MKKKERKKTNSSAVLKFKNDSIQATVTTQRCSFTLPPNYSCIASCMSTNDRFLWANLFNYMDVLQAFRSWCVRRRHSFVYLSTTNLAHKQCAFGAHSFFTHFRNYTAQWLRELFVVVATARIEFTSRACMYRDVSETKESGYRMLASQDCSEPYVLLFFAAITHTHTTVRSNTTIRIYSINVCSHHRSTIKVELCISIRFELNSTTEWTTKRNVMNYIARRAFINILIFHPYSFHDDVTRLQFGFFHAIECIIDALVVYDLLTLNE